MIGNIYPPTLKKKDGSFIAFHQRPFGLSCHNSSPSRNWSLQRPSKITANWMTFTSQQQQQQQQQQQLSELSIPFRKSTTWQLKKKQRLGVKITVGVFLVTFQPRGSSYDSPKIFVGKDRPLQFNVKTCKMVPWKRRIPFGKYDFPVPCEILGGICLCMFMAALRMRIRTNPTKKKSSVPSKI